MPAGIASLRWLPALGLGVMLSAGAQSLRPGQSPWMMEGSTCPADEWATQAAACLVVDARPRLLSLDKATTFVIAVPVPGQVARALVVQGEPSHSRKGLWSGRILGDAFSNVTLARVGRAVAGRITSSTGPAYRIRSTSSGRVVIELLRDDAVPPDLVVRVSSADERKGRDIACTGQKPSDVRLLVVYTKAAEGAAGGSDAMEAAINVALKRVNDSFAQSLIRHRVVRAGFEAIDYPDPGNSELNLPALLDRLIDGEEDDLRKVHELRGTKAGDLVAFITHGGSGAIAKQFEERHIGSTSFSRYGYAVIPLSALTGSDALAHELGHLLGAGHHEDNPPTGASDWSKGFHQTGTGQARGWQTIMAGPCEGCGKLLYWSSPHVTGPWGQKMGDEVHDNARTITETACTVAGYEGEGPGGLTPR